MDLKRYSSNYSKISAWLSLKEEIFYNIEEIPSQRITYNASLLPLSSLAWKIDSIQNRLYPPNYSQSKHYNIFSILMGNKSLAITDLLDKNRTDATLFPEE